MAENGVAENAVAGSGLATAIGEMNERGSERRPIAWRVLVWLWGVVLVGAVAAAGTLAYLGPPMPASGREAPGQFAAKSDAGPAQSPAQPATADAAAPRPAPAAAAPLLLPPLLPPPAGTPIAQPDAALLEPAQFNAPAKLPRIAPDHRTPMEVYAAGFDPTDKRPRIAILLAGIGQSSVDSDDALQALPPAVSFAMSPYVPNTEHLLADIRAKGHEMLISLPMEPQGYPVNDEGNRSMLIGSVASQNAQRLDWALSRMMGYVGATNALDGLRGERFSASSTQMQSVLEQLAARGLMYVDAAPDVSRIQPDSVPGLVARRIDIAVDAIAVRNEIDWKLAQLEDIARDRGTALGLASLPRPVTVERIAAWAATLQQRGFALAPVSVVVRTRVANEASPVTKTTLSR